MKLPDEPGQHEKKLIFKAVGVLLISVSVFFAVTFQVHAEEAADAGINPEKSCYIRIRMERNVTVKPEEIRLGDMAVIEAPDGISEEISAFPVGSAPKPGRSRNFRTAMIKSRIMDMAESCSGDKNEKDIIIDIPDMVLVKRDFQHIPDNALKGYYEKKAEEISAGDSFEISDFRIRGKNIFPAGNMEIKPVEAFRGMNMGNLSLPVEIYVDGAMEGRLTLSGRIEKHINVVCAARDIRKNDMVEASDIRVEKRGAEKRIGAGFLTDMSLAVGKQTRSDIRSGAVLFEKNLVIPSVLKKGDRVRLVAKSGRLSIQTLAEAMSDGKAGERIRVRNIDTGKYVNATVVDSATVETVF